MHLSGLAESSVDIEGFLEDEEDLHVPLSRTCFEEVCAPLKVKEFSLRRGGPASGLHLSAVLERL